ncbi:MAG: hypothetical protein ACE5IR_04740 [bacterium]
MKNMGMLSQILLLSLVNVVYAGDAYKIQYNFKKGTAHRYQITSSSESVQEIMGSEQISESESKAQITVSAVGVDDNRNFNITVVYDALEVDVFATGMDSTFKNPPGIVGKRVKKVIKPDGDQLESTELDSFGVLQFAPMFTSDREILPNLPNVELKMNEAVTATDVDSTNAFGGQVITNSKSEYTLHGKEDMAGYECLKISYKSTVTLTGSGSRFGADFSIEGDGGSTGVMFFAHKQGILVSTESTTDMEITVAITGPQNMTIPISQTSESTFKLIQ